MAAQLQLQLQSKLKHTINTADSTSSTPTPSSVPSNNATPTGTGTTTNSAVTSTATPGSGGSGAGISGNQNGSAGSAANSASNAVPTFEFTRRKRWADILINEVPENIILVLSPNGIIWFSGVAMVELLGWTIEEVLDKDFLCFVNETDQTIFRNCFFESLATGELFTYVRLRCKKDMIVNPDSSRTYRELLFEIKGYPHYVADDPRCKCFFAMARPYPTRSAAFLNTFLELKVENERLKLQQEHVHRSIASIPSSLLTPSVALPALSAVGFPGFPQTFFNATQDGSLSGAVGGGGDAKSGVGVGVGGNGMGTSMNVGVGVVGQPNSSLAGSSGVGTAGPGAGTVTYGILAATNAFGYPGTMAFEEETEVASVVAGTSSNSNSGPGSKRKTSRAFPDERYVCVSCGRTDSPEWRKGPAGPKTLCNACGLRYAKKARKMPAEERDAASTSLANSNNNTPIVITSNGGPTQNGSGGNIGGLSSQQNQGFYKNGSRNGSAVSIGGVGPGAGGYSLPPSTTYAGFQQG